MARFDLFPRHPGPPKMRFGMTEPQKHTIQTANLRRYDWMFRVCLLSKEDVVTDLARPSGLALLQSAMPGASGPTVLWSDLEEKKIYGIDVAEENSTREVWVEGTRRVFLFWKW